MRGKQKKWSAADEELLRELWPSIPGPELTTVFDRSYLSIKSRAKKLKLYKNPSLRHQWTDAQIKQLRKLYPDTPTQDLVAEFKQSVEKIHSAAARYSIRKSEEFLASPHCRRLDGRIGCKTRFKPGHVPANKGIKGWDAGGRSHETRFKKGQRGNKFVPIGSERLTPDGYLQRKVSATGYPPRDWQAVHVLLWVEHNGPIPEGSVVVFKDGDRKNIVIENLEMITRGELALRNTIHRYPREVKCAIRAVHKLNRAIENQEQLTNEK